MALLSFFSASLHRSLKGEKRMGGLRDIKSGREGEAKTRDESLICEEDLLNTIALYPHPRKILE